MDFLNNQNLLRNLRQNAINQQKNNKTNSNKAKDEKPKTIFDNKTDKKDDSFYGNAISFSNNKNDNEPKINLYSNNKSLNLALSNILNNLQNRQATQKTTASDNKTVNNQSSDNVKSENILKNDMVSESPATNAKSAEQVTDVQQPTQPSDTNSLSSNKAQQSRQVTYVKFVDGTLCDYDNKPYTGVYNGKTYENGVALTAEEIAKREEVKKQIQKIVDRYKDDLQSWINAEIYSCIVTGNEMYCSDDWYELANVESTLNSYKRSISRYKDASKAPQFAFIEEYKYGHVSKVTVEVVGNIGTVTETTDKNGNKVKTTEIPAYKDEDGVFHPAQVIEEGLNDAGNTYTVTKTQNADGTWTGHREVYDKEKGYKRYEADIIYDSTGKNKLTENYTTYDQTNFAYQTGNIEYYSNGNKKNEKLEMYDVANDCLTNKTIEYYDNGNKKNEIRITSYSTNVENDDKFSDVNYEYKRDIKQGTWKNEYYDNGKLKTQNIEFIDHYDGIIKSTSRKFDYQGVLTNEVVSDYAKIETLSGTMHSGGITSDITPQYDSQGNLTGYIVSKSVIGSGEKLGTYNADKDGNWISNISTEDCDGKIGYFNQGEAGTCQLLSVVKNLDNAGIDFVKEGIIRWNSDGSATVKLYKLDKNDKPTNDVKEYTISVTSLANNVYPGENGTTIAGVSGDRTVVALERAYAQYMIEKKGNGNLSDTATSSHEVSDSILASSSIDVINILFGKDGSQQYSPEMYVFSSNSMPLEQAKTATFRPNASILGIPGVTSSSLSKYLTKINNDYYIKDTKGNYIQLFYPHNYTIENYDNNKNTVTLTNPHNYSSFEVDADAVRHCFFAVTYDIPDYNYQ